MDVVTMLMEEVALAMCSVSSETGLEAGVLKSRGHGSKCAKARWK